MQQSRLIRRRMWVLLDRLPDVSVNGVRQWPEWSMIEISRTVRGRRVPPGRAGHMITLEAKSCPLICLFALLLDCRRQFDEIGNVDAEGFL